jgi:hypothetical protein
MMAWRVFREQQAQRAAFSHFASDAKAMASLETMRAMFALDDIQTTPQAESSGPVPAAPASAPPASTSPPTTSTTSTTPPAGAVMIGHTPSEFWFDFITTFFPRSAVSARVYLTAQQVPNLLTMLTTSYKAHQRKHGGSPPLEKPAPE